MSHINFDKGSGKKKGLIGFYIALAVCIVAVGGVAVATFTTPKVPKDDVESGGQPYATTVTEAQPVEQNVTNVPDDRTTAATKAESDTRTTAVSDLFILPLSNQVIREFSSTQPVYSPTMNDWRVHNGVDFKGEQNQTVKALADGTILSVDTDTYWGNVITIDHGFGIKSKYCGVTASVKAKDTVKVGDKIGTLSDIPCEANDGYHLHLEITVNDEFVNPVEAIGRDVETINTTTAAG